jgi:hypothetical protein
MFQNKIKTEDNLFKRGDLDQWSLKCVEEYESEESIPHCFLSVLYFLGILCTMCQWFRKSSAFQKVSCT